MGGIRFGNVKKVQFVAEADGQPSEFDVTLSVEKGVVVPRTATVAVTQSVLGSGTVLVIRLANGPPGMHLGPTEELAAAPIQSTLELLFGIDRAKNLEAAMVTFQTFDPKPSVQDAKERFAVLVNESAALKTEVASDVDGWRPQAIAVLDAFDTARIRMDEIEAIFAPAGALDRARLEPAFERISVNFTASATLIASMRTRWNGEVLPPLNDLIDRFRKSFAIVKGDYERLVTLLDGGSETIGSVNADLQIAGHQMRAAQHEITLMPWTLLGGAIADKGEQEQFKVIARELLRSTTELHLSVTAAKELLAQDPRLVERYPELSELLKNWMTRSAAEQDVAAEQILNRLIGAPTSK